MGQAQSKTNLEDETNSAFDDSVISAGHSDISFDSNNRPTKLKSKGNKTKSKPKSSLSGSYEVIDTPEKASSFGNFGNMSMSSSRLSSLNNSMISCDENDFEILPYDGSPKHYRTWRKGRNTAAGQKTTKLDLKKEEVCNTPVKQNDVSSAAGLDSFVVVDTPKVAEELQKYDTGQKIKDVATIEQGNRATVTHGKSAKSVISNSGHVAANNGTSVDKSTKARGVALKEKTKPNVSIVKTETAQSVKFSTVQETDLDIVIHNLPKTTTRPLCSSPAQPPTPIDKSVKPSQGVNSQMMDLSDQINVMDKKPTEKLNRSVSYVVPSNATLRNRTDYHVMSDELKQKRKTASLYGTLPRKKTTGGVKATDLDAIEQLNLSPGYSNRKSTDDFSYPGSLRQIFLSQVASNISWDTKEQNQSSLGPLDRGNKLLVTNSPVQSQPVAVKSSSVQREPVAVSTSPVQNQSVAVKRSSVLSQPVAVSTSPVQNQPVAVKRSSVQSQPVTVKSSHMHIQPVTVKSSPVQRETVAVKSSFVQSQPVAVKSSPMQSQLVAVKSSFVQRQPGAVSTSPMQSQVYYDTVSSSPVQRETVAVSSSPMQRQPGAASTSPVQRETVTVTKVINISSDPGLRMNKDTRLFGRNDEHESCNAASGGPPVRVFTNISDKKRISQYVATEWKGNTVNAKAMRKGYGMILSILECNSLRIIRGDNYCAVRGPLYQSLVNNVISIKLGHDLEHITQVPDWFINSGYHWVSDWSFAHRLGYVKNVVQTMKHCLQVLEDQIQLVRGTAALSDREAHILDAFNTTETDLYLVEAVKILMLYNAIRLYEDNTTGKEVPVFVWLMYARDTSPNPQQFMKHHLNSVGDSAGVEQVEMFLMGYTLGVTLKVVRPSQVQKDDFITYYPDDHLNDWNKVVLIAEDDRHYNIALK